MKRILLTIICLAAFCAAARAQDSSSNARRLFSGTVDPNTLGTSCIVGPPFTDYYIKTDDHSEWQCTNVIGTWTKVVSGGTPGTVTNVSGTTPISVATGTTTPVVSCSTCEVTGNKDATGGYAGLTLFKLNFKNAANTFTSFLANTNSAARTYNFQDRNGTIADDTDLGLKAPLASPALTGNPTAPTQSQADNSTKVATTAYVDTGLAGKQNTLSLPLPATNGGTGQSTYTKGDILASPGSNLLNKLGVGSDGQVLTADAASTNGVKWAAAAAAGIGGSLGSTPNAVVRTSGAGGATAQGSLATIDDNGYVLSPRYQISDAGVYINKPFSGSMGMNVGAGLIARFIAPSEGFDGLYFDGTAHAIYFNGNLVLNSSGINVPAATFTALASDATHTDNTVCVDSSSGVLYKGSATLGICLGTSSARFKHGIQPLGSNLRQMMALRPVSFFYNKGYGDSGAKRQFGFTAEDVNKVAPELVGLDAKGKPNSVDLLALVPKIISAMQEQQAQIHTLQLRVAAQQRTIKRLCHKR